MNLKFWEWFKPAPRRFWTSDLHFGHRNVIDYCNRPWADLEAMHEAIIVQWNSQVRKQDHAFVLGDFSLNPKWCEIILPRLNGYKTLVTGNHDSVFPHIGRSKNKIENMVERYRKAGWNEVYYQGPIWYKLKDGTSVILSHFPYDTEYDTRYEEHRPMDDGLILLHGHLHGKYRKKGRQIDVCFDGDLKLWSEDEIIEIIKDPREFIPTPITEYYIARGIDKENGLKGAT